MIQACHYTLKQSYHRIKKDGVLKSSKTRLRSGEVVEHNSLVEWILGDKEYIFFSVFKPDMDIEDICSSRYGPFGFIFDAEQLIKDYDGLASIELQTQYGELQESIAKEVYAKLNPDSTEDDGGFYDILLPMLDRYEEDEGVTEALSLLDARSATLRSENRVASDEALSLIQRNLETDLEILVEVNVPVEIAVAEIIDKEYVIRS